MVIVHAPLLPATQLVQSSIFATFLSPRWVPFRNPDFPKKPCIDFLTLVRGKEVTKVLEIVDLAVTQINSLFTNLVDIPLVGVKLSLLPTWSGKILKFPPL